jgi:cytochrome c peroxidase
MAGKATRTKQSNVIIALLFLFGFGVVLIVKAKVGGVVFFTQDSVSLISLADDLAHGRLPNLEQYAKGLPVNPWPLAYPALVALLSLGGLLKYELGCIVLQALALFSVLWVSTSKREYTGWILALASESALWLLGHGWSEFLFVAGILLTARTLDSNLQRAFWPASLALHARQPALPSIVFGYFFLKDKKRSFWPFVLSIATVVLYFIWNAIYTEQAFGGPRTPVSKDYSAWFANTANAALKELCWIKDTHTTWLIVLQLGLLAYIISQVRLRNESSRFIIGAGLGYGIVTVASHAVIRFSEDLDCRLMGPAMVLVLAGIFQEAKIKTQLVYSFAVLLLVISLPYRSFLSLSEPSSRYTPTPYILKLPSWVPAQPIIPSDNPLTVEGIALGRALFHDKRLSGNANISCATCHRPGMAFSERGIIRKGIRSTPSLLNVAWQPLLFADGGVLNLESVALAPLHSKNEMGGSLKTVRQLMRTDRKYQRMVKLAFGVDSAESIHFLRALAQFQRTLISTGAKADNAHWKPSKQELLGRQLFIEACQRCHTPPIYTNNQFYAVYRVPPKPLKPIPNILNGRYRITQNLKDLGAYKPPSLRNAAITYPYMHDASVASLEGCLHHGDYSIGQLARNHRLQSNHISRALVLYIEALTDTIPKLK